MFIKDIAGSILRDQSPKKYQTFKHSLLDVRNKFYQLLANCIPADVIIKNLIFEILQHVDSQLKKEMIGIAADYEHRMRLGNKAIFHLEAFAAKIMSIYAQFLMDFS